MSAEEKQSRMASRPTDRMKLADALNDYFVSVKEVFATGQAREHAYRPAQITLFNRFNDVLTVNDAAKSEAGFPDFTFLMRSNTEITRGYGEGKDLGANLNLIEKTDQLLKYGAYDNLLLTNVLEFRFYAHGETGTPITLATVDKKTITVQTSAFEGLIDEFAAFLEQPPEKIRSARRLAEIMGGKARRIRAEANRLLSEPETKGKGINDVYQLVRKTLSHDMTGEDFADMYAQTLVYGLFAARFHDPDLESFSRQEARDLIAQETDFLKHFFDHIAGASFPSDLVLVVNELCEVLRVSNVRSIVSAHLKKGDHGGLDPIIHFYELFLKEYDAEQRKDRGVYYTPTPVVRYIVRAVDRALIDHFGIANGLADSEKKKYAFEVNSGYNTNKRSKKAAPVVQERNLHRVQILDPAVGTATFLNEAIRHIHSKFENQAGMWPGYVKDELLPRLHGFELMMAPYSIAHLKLAMTLDELGVPSPGAPVGVYLTNTLDQATEFDHDLFTIGLAAAFSAEATKASQIKTEAPIMVVMGNPPYSGHSENRSVHARALVDRYKVEPGGQSKLDERNPKWLNDDYVKFIAFAEEMVAKNSDGGIMAMITNNGYLDNPTFRGMR
ncbi:MAG TPA: N-6 DNA methylase, partial [Aeromicrobium sp.]|nr:N-6 DNA methylase [Aeromicrobium sp.]